MIVNRTSEITLKYWLLKPLAIRRVKYLQKRYKKLSDVNRHRQSNRNLNKLRLIQNQLYYWKNEFTYWGCFHPNCVGNKKQEKFYKDLFPIKDFDEINLVVIHNPEANTYYLNKIYHLDGSAPNDIVAQEIEKQLKKWKKWN